MCALQMQAEAGPTLIDSPDALEAGIEKYVVKQVGANLLTRMCGGLVITCFYISPAINLCSGRAGQEAQGALLYSECALPNALWQ